MNITLHILANRLGGCQTKPPYDFSNPMLSCFLSIKNACCFSESDRSGAHTTNCQQFFTKIEHLNFLVLAISSSFSAHKNSVSMTMRHIEIAVKAHCHDDLAFIALRESPNRTATKT
jgi:hypothetical protein